MCLCVWCYGLVVTGSRPDLHLLGLVLTGKHWKAIVVFVCWYQVVFYLQTETICLVSAQARISWNCVGVVSRDCALCALLYLWLKSLEKSLNPGLCELCCDKKEPNPVSGQSVQLLMELIKSCLVDPSCNMSDKISHTDLSLLPGMAQPAKWSPCYLRYLERTCLFSCHPLVLSLEILSLILVFIPVFGWHSQYLLLLSLTDTHHSTTCTGNLLKTTKRKHNFDRRKIIIYFWLAVSEQRTH